MTALHGAILVETTLAHAVLVRSSSIATVRLSNLNKGTTWACGLKESLPSSHSRPD
jgi:hypothetical protein